MANRLALGDYLGSSKSNYYYFTTTRSININNFSGLVYIKLIKVYDDLLENVIIFILASDIFLLHIIINIQWHN